MLIFSILFSLSLSPRQRRIDYAIIFAIAIAIDAFGFHFRLITIFALLSLLFSFIDIITLYFTPARH
jgi:hypothetical protein